MKYYELSTARLGSSRLRFGEGRLWRADSSNWGVDLLGVRGVARFDWRAPVRFEAAGAGGERLAGDALVDALDQAPPATTRIRLCAGGELAVAAPRGRVRSSVEAATQEIEREAA